MHRYAIAVFGTADEVNDFLIALWNQSLFSIVKRFVPDENFSEGFYALIETLLPIEYMEVKELSLQCSLPFKPVQVGLTELGFTAH